jgi:hypothetical protein
MDTAKAVVAITQAIEALNNLLAVMQETPPNSKDRLNALVETTPSPAGRTMVRWTKEEHDYLCNMWGKLSAETIAKRLGRTANAINARACNHYLTQTNRYNPHDNQM